MGFEHIGIGGILRFDEGRAVRSMGRAQKAFGGLNRSVRRFQGGVRQVGMALPILGMALSAATIPFVMGAGAAMNFQHTMAGVQAVTYNTAEDMARLERRAVDLSIASVFAASEVGGAMEMLGRAGFQTGEILTAVGKVLDTAAAEGMGMADAARIITSNVRAWNMEASKTGRIADVLALASASANTTIVELAESLKMATPFARGMGVTFEETVTTLGLLADAGLTATLGGTAFKNAMLKLAAPTGKGTKVIRKMGLTVANAAGDFIGMEAILKQLATGMNVYGGSVDRTAAMAELFGLRGVAITNILGRLDKATAGTAMTFGEFHKRLVNATGAAAKMAATRLDTLTGKLKLIKGSLEAFWITVLGPSLDPVATAVQGLIDRFNTLVEAIRFVLMPLDELAKLADDERLKFEAIGPATWAVARGIVDAMDTIKRAIGDVIAKVKKLASTLGLDQLGPEGVRKITRLAFSFMALAAVLGPVLLLSAGLGFAFQGVTMLAGGLTKITYALAAGLWWLAAASFHAAVGLAAVAGSATTAVSVLGLKGAIIYGWLKLAPAIAAVVPVITGIAIAVAVLATVFLGLRKEGESVGGTFKRVTGAIADWFKRIIGTIPAMWARLREGATQVFAPWWAGITKLADTLTSILRPILVGIGGVLQQVFRAVGDAFGTGVRIIGKLIYVTGCAFDLFMSAFSLFRPVFRTLLGGIFAVLIAVLKAVVWVLGRLWKGLEFVFNIAVAVVAVAIKIGVAYLKWIAPVLKGLLLVAKAVWFIVKLFLKLGAYLVGKGLKVITRFAEWFWDKIEPVRDLVQSIVDTVSGPLTNAWEGIINVLKRVASAVRDNVMKPIRWAAGLLADALEAVSKVPGLKQLVGKEGAALILELRGFERGEILEPEPPPTGISDMEAQLEARRERPPETVVTVTNQPTQVDVNATLEVDGRILARAQAQYEIELGERAGAKITPWQRRALVVDASGMGLT